MARETGQQGGTGGLAAAAEVESAIERRPQSQGAEADGRCPNAGQKLAPGAPASGYLRPLYLRPEFSFNFSLFLSFPYGAQENGAGILIFPCRLSSSRFPSVLGRMARFGQQFIGRWSFANRGQAVRTPPKWVITPAFGFAIALAVYHCWLERRIQEQVCRANLQNLAATSPDKRSEEHTSEL